MDAVTQKCLVREAATHTHSVIKIKAYHRRGA